MSPLRILTSMGEMRILVGAVTLIFGLMSALADTSRTELRPPGAVVASAADPQMVPAAKPGQCRIWKLTDPAKYRKYCT